MAVPSWPRYVVYRKIGLFFASSSGHDGCQGSIEFFDYGPRLRGKNKREEGVAMLHVLHMLCLATAGASASLLSDYVEHVMVSELYS
jgi:hypothetical protein